MTFTVNQRADARTETPGAGDRELLERLLAGDEAAFETLVATLHGPMLRFVRTFVSRADVAEEVVQETWLTVLRGLQGFEGRSSLKTWIFHILANRARTRATRDASAAAASAAVSKILMSIYRDGPRPSTLLGAS